MPQCLQSSSDRNKYFQVLHKLKWSLFAEDLENNFTIGAIYTFVTVILVNLIAS